MKTKVIFKIFDWAGNDKSDYYGTFKTLDDAYSALYAEFKDLEGDELDKQIDEFYVQEKIVKG